MARWRVKPGCVVVKADGVVVHAGQHLRDSELVAGDLARVHDLLEMVPEEANVPRRDRSRHDPNDPKGKPDFPTR